MSNATPWESPDEVIVLLASGLLGAFIGHGLLNAYKGGDDEDHKDKAFLVLLVIVLAFLGFACYVRFKKSPRTPD